ncbi:cytochrome P450 4V2-like [Tropilaelaps mercedesae]|uniref:Cytochrome P450 4V2-like n=1 Tax=Tropilaelaps mercedesae TaxID=418985 RepID=A0A1V9X7M1_9ACAR|nr:cytochrome P450 4V2-like [Tropilaelaps mercedesae]
MVPLSSIAAVIVFLYMLSAVLWLWRRSKIWQHPLPEPGYNIGFASLLCPFYSEISFIVRAWREAPMDFLANINNSVEMLCHTFDRDGIYRIWLGSHPFVLVYEPNAVEALLSSSEHIEKAESYSALHEWLGTGLLTSNGSKWRARRKLLTPTFHFAILEDFIEIFNRHSQQFATRLENKFGNGTKIFDIFAEAPLCTLDIICAEQD